MPVEIKLPQLGESIHEGTIARWLKKPGDRVEKYEPLVEITTDKVNVEMPSPYAGVLVEWLAAEGDTKPVGAPIALLEATADASAGTAPVPAEAAGSAPAVQASASAPPQTVAAAAAAGARTGGMRLSPLVRRLAEEHGIGADVLARLPGSGAGGRVTKDDVLRYLAEREVAERPRTPAPARGPEPVRGLEPAPGAEPAASARPVEAPGLRPGDELVKVSPIRRTIAQRMAQSKREIPHAYGVIEVDMSAVVAYREAQKEAWRAREGVPLTYTAFFVAAACEALRAYPIVNAAWSDEGIVLRRGVHIGIGIAVEDGLLVPVIHDADRLSLPGIARALHDLTERARTGRLGLDDIQGGTFTITNPGVFGSIWSMPIIVPGQAAILATDAIVKRAVVRDDAIAIRPIMHLGLSFDHRLFDGATAMRFLNHLKGWFEGFRNGR